MDTLKTAKNMVKMINDFFDKKDDTCNLICQLAEKLDAYERLGTVDELEELKEKDTPSASYEDDRYLWGS